MILRTKQQHTYEIGCKYRSVTAVATFTEHPTVSTHQQPYSIFSLDLSIEVGGPLAPILQMTTLKSEA